jgi:hypothetical protein
MAIELLTRAAANSVGESNSDNERADDEKYRKSFKGAAFFMNMGASFDLIGKSDQGREWGHCECSDKC